jgi:hypothetical protein
MGARRGRQATSGHRPPLSRGLLVGQQSDAPGRLATNGRPLASAWALELLGCAPFFFASLPHFFLMGSTPPHWLQHMPALPRLLLKTSNTHNFWSIAPKIMKFALTRSVFRDAFGKNSKVLKIVWFQTTLPKIGLAPVGPIHPLRVKQLL